MPGLDRLHRIDIREPQWRSLLEGLVQRLIEAGPVNKIFLFGSFVRNEVTEASDIDLLVVVPNDEDTRQFRMRLPSPFSSWPTDLVLVTETRFQERKDFGGVIFEAYQGGVELYPHWSWEPNS